MFKRPPATPIHMAIISIINILWIAKWLGEKTGINWSYVDFESLSGVLGRIKIYFQLCWIAGVSWNLFSLADNLADYGSCSWSCVEVNQDYLLPGAQG